MSSPQVNALHVANNSPALVNVILVLSNGTEIPLDPGASIHPSNEQVLNLTTIGGLNDGDTFTVRVRVYHSGQTADNDTVLTYVDSVAKEGIYTVEGTAVAPSLNYVGTGPYPKPRPKTASLIAQVQALRVTNNSSAIAQVSLVLSNGTEIRPVQGASIHPRRIQFIDLTTIGGLNDGDTFITRIGLSSTDSDYLLTYIHDARKVALYTIDSNGVHYDGTAPF